MTIYINADTNEYPCYEGDKNLNPNANWVEVEGSVPEIGSDEICLEVAPQQIDGKYVRQFVIRQKTEAEILREQQSAEAFKKGEDPLLDAYWG
jgi:hypothetical protein